MQGGQQQRDNVDLVPCIGCKGNVRIKVPRLVMRSTVAAVLPAGVNPHAVTPQRVFSDKGRGTANHAKVLVREQVYFQRRGEPRVMLETKFERNSADVLHRALSLEPMIVGPEWTAPDFSGYPDKVAQVIIANLEGVFHVIPTPEQFAAQMNRVVELGFGDNPVGDQIISPRQAQRYEVASLARVRLRCPSGTATVLITVFPG